jgi:hypothetical protein
MGVQTPRDTGDLAALDGRDLVRQHRYHRGEQRVEEQLGDTPSGEDDRDAGCQRDNEDAEGTARQAGDHPWTPHAQPRRAAVAHPAEERITDHRYQGADPGDKRQAAGCLFDPNQRVHLQRQGDQHGREEQEAGAHVRQRVLRDETPADPACPVRLGLQCRLGAIRYFKQSSPPSEADMGWRWGRYPRPGNVGYCAPLKTGGPRTPATNPVLLTRRCLDLRRRA